MTNVQRIEAALRIAGLGAVTLAIAAVDWRAGLAALGVSLILVTFDWRLP